MSKHPVSAAQAYFSTAIPPRDFARRDGGLACQNIRREVEYMRQTAEETHRNAVLAERANRRQNTACEYKMRYVLRLPKCCVFCVNICNMFVNY